MLRYVVASIGGILCLCGLGYFFSVLWLEIFGIKAEAEVVSSRKRDDGLYVHTLKFSDGSEREDKTGLSQPISTGTVKSVVCSRSNPNRFEYAEQLSKNIVISLIMAVLAALIVVRFLFGVID